MKVRDVVEGRRLIAQGRANGRPKVSIVTPTYRRNAEGLLSRCIQSALDQTFTDFEYIIVDDGSNDGSEETIREYAAIDERIIYYRHDKNSGLPAVRTNEAIMLAKGEAIAFLFDDNVLDSEFLEKATLELFSSDVDVVHTNVKMLGVAGHDFLLGNWPLTLELLRNLNTIPNGGVLCRKSFFYKFGLYDPHLILRRICDWDLWLRSLRLGAKFKHVECISAIEHGLISENSLGNTVEWDVKIAYGYFLDEKKYIERVKRLLPDNIFDFDVLDPSVIEPYVRNRQEWNEMLETVYRPFLERHNISDVDPWALTNRSEAFSSPKGFSSDGPFQNQWLFANGRKRVLVVSNAVGAWASGWISALSENPDRVVLNCPEWQLSAFRPVDIDLLVLLDTCAGFVVPYVNEFKAAGVPIIYLLCFGMDDTRKPLDTMIARQFDNCGSIIDGLGLKVFFPQPGLQFSIDQSSVAKQLIRVADLAVGDRTQISKLGYQGRVCQIPRFDIFCKEAVCTSITLRYDVNTPYDSEVESVVPPGEMTKGSVRESWESLGSVCRTRSGGVVVVKEAYIDSLPDSEVFGLGLESELSGTRFIRSQIRPCSWGLRENRATGVALSTTIANLARSVEVSQALARGGGGAKSRPRLLVALNSELLSGSEMYGLMIARNCALLGFDVSVCTPEQPIYTRTQEKRSIDCWLDEHEMSKSFAGPYGASNQFFSSASESQRVQSERLSEFLDSHMPDIVLCSGFLPVFAYAIHPRRLLIMSFFQPSAYDGSLLKTIRHRLSGWISDCNWSRNSLAKVLDGPSAVVRSTFPIEESSVALESGFPKRVGQGIRIAIGGTFQPRKGQLRAVQAVANLRKKGYDVSLNMYGYALPELEDYVKKIDETIKNLELSNFIKRHGLVTMVELTKENDIILSASTDESLPQTVGEAMFRGLVPVVTLSGGIDELVVDGENGFICPSPSPIGLEDGIKRAILNQNEWQGMIESSKKLLASKYSVAETTKDLLEFFYDACDYKRLSLDNVGFSISQENCGNKYDTQESEDFKKILENIYEKLHQFNLEQGQNIQ